jgi:outer membrane protein assembly factor BamB
MLNRGCLALALIVSNGCIQSSTTAYIEPQRGTLRAGVLELRWRRRMVEPAALDWFPVARSAPAYDPETDRLYLGTIDNAFYALRGRDGAMLWRFQTLGRVDSLPTIHGSYVYFGCSDGAVYAVDRETGVMHWRTGTSAEVYHPPIITSDGVYFVNANDTVYGLNREDGHVRWRYHRNAPGRITLSGHAGLLSAGDRIYAAFSDGNVICLDPGDGSVVWEQDTSIDIESLDDPNETHDSMDVDTTPILIGDTLFVASYTAGVYALDLVGGSRRWRREDVGGVSVLSTDGEFLYASSARLGLVKIDPFDGMVLWSRDLGTPALLGASPMEGGMLAVA